MRLFGQWQIQDDLVADRLKLHETCNEINLHKNHVKTGIAGTTLVVTGEHVVTAGADLSVLTQVSIQVVLSAVHLWHQRMLGIDPETGQTAGDGCPDRVPEIFVVGTEPELCEEHVGGFRRWWRRLFRRDSEARPPV